MYSVNDSYRSLPAEFESEPAKQFAIVTLNSPGGHGYHRRSSTWMWPYTIANRIAYAETRGYALHIEGPEVVDPMTPPSWSKIKVIRKHLLRYPYVLWVDVDVLFMTHSKQLEDFVAEHPSSDVIAAKDFNGLNCGVMLFRRSPWTLDFLDRIWHFSGDRSNMWQEQFAMMEALKHSQDDESHFAFVMQYDLNAYTHVAEHASARWKKGKLLVHFANCDGRPHTCWDEFQYYTKLAEADNGIPELTQPQLRQQPLQVHIW